MPKNQGRGHVYLRGDLYWIKYHKHGKPFYESTHSRRYKDAVALLNKRLVNPVAVRTGPTMIGELLNDYLEYFRVHHPKSFESYGKSRVTAVRPFWGDLKADAVTSQDIKEYVKQRLAKGVSNATINRDMAVLKKSFNLGQEATPPKVGNRFPKFRRLPEAEPRRGFLETPQYQSLLEALPVELRVALVIGYHTGSRKGEILKIRIDQVDLKDEKIRLYDTKKHVEGRWLPIYGDMKKELEKQITWTRWVSPGCPWLVHREGRRFKRFDHNWEVACKQVGLDGVLFHDLRRSAVRNMVRAGIPDAVAMKISGHKTRAVFDRYNIVSGKDIEDAGKKLTEFLKGQEKKAETE